MEFKKGAFAKSAIVSTTSIALFSMFGMPLLAELILVGVITKLLRTKVLDNEQLHSLILKESSQIILNIKELDKENLVEKLSKLKKAS